MEEANNSPIIIIIGAGRSGTNILRDVLCSVKDFETWPCDEINYIWRHGNINEPSDEFGPEHATRKVKKYVRNEFHKFARKSNASTVVEKTCANSLRVSFVNEIFPEALFIHIIRDGRDVVNSARKRWTAELDPKYILKKAKYIPVSDIPYYGFKYLGNRIYRLFSEEGRLATWGPRFKGMDKIVEEYSLEEVCAYQWKRCVKKADEELSMLDSGRVHTLRYEDFAVNTGEEVKKLLSFLEISNGNVDVSKMADMVHAGSEGRWKTELSGQQVKNIENIISPVLDTLGINN